MLRHPHPRTFLPTSLFRPDWPNFPALFRRSPVRPTALTSSPAIPTPARAMSALLPSISRGAGLAVELASTVPSAKASLDGCKPSDMSC